MSGTRSASGYTLIFQKGAKAGVTARLELLITKMAFLASKVRSNLAGGPNMVSPYWAQHNMVRTALLDERRGCSLPQPGKRLGDPQMCSKDSRGQGPSAVSRSFCLCSER